MSEYDHFTAQGTAHGAGEESDRIEHNPFLDSSLGSSIGSSSLAPSSAQATAEAASSVLIKRTVANRFISKHASFDMRKYITNVADIANVTNDMMGLNAQAQGTRAQGAQARNVRRIQEVPDASDAPDVHEALTRRRTGVCTNLQRLWRSIGLAIANYTRIANYTQQQTQQRPLAVLSSQALQEPPLLHELLVHMQHMLLLPPFAFSEEEQQQILAEAKQLAREHGLFLLGLALFLADRQPHGLIACVAAPHFSKQQLYTWLQQEGKKTLHQQAEESIAHDIQNLQKTKLSDIIAKTMATILTTRVGLLNVGLLEDLPAFLALVSPQKAHASLPPDGPPDGPSEWLIQRLQRLRDLPLLRQQLHSLKVSQLHQVGVACIRATWNISQEESLTCREICKTLLATFLSPLRQQKGEEDCFAVAVIIPVIEESPEQEMDDLCSLLLHGTLTRTVEGKPVVFPWFSTGLATENEGSRYSLPLQHAWRQVVASMSETPRQGTCTERFVAATMPLFHILGAQIGSILERKVQMLLKDSFRWIYQPSHYDHEGVKGSFALYVVQGNAWKKITSLEELSQALVDFTQESWPEEQQRTEKQRFLYAQLVTEGVALSLINRYRKAFQVEKIAKDVDPVSLHCTPWITYTRGNAESVWHTYHEEPIYPDKAFFSVIPETGERLIALLVEWLRWHISKHPRMHEPHRLTVRIEDVHAFSVLPTHWLLKLANETETISLEKWIKRHLQDPLTPLSQANASPEMRDKLIRFVLQNLINSACYKDVDAALHALEHPLSICVLRHRLCEIALQGQASNKMNTHTLKEIQQSIDAYMIELLSPQEREFLEAHALMIGDSNWSDEKGNNRYFYLALHPGSNQLSLFLGELDKGNHEPLNLVLLPSSPWLSQRWQLLSLS